MDNLGCVQVPPVPKKDKKKQAKDELDRIKQAEKKKRRLEKALATSAAIRSELEKKKQKKKEEQQRLDEEGAAIAEAVALHVLLGEDSDDRQVMLKKNEGIDRWDCASNIDLLQVMLKKNERFDLWDCASNIDLFMGGWRAGLPPQSITKYSVGGLGWVSGAYGSDYKWNDWGIGWSLSPALLGRDIHASYIEDEGRRTEISAGLMAAQAVSSLQIAEDGHADAFTSESTATIVINGMFEGSGLGGRVNLYKEV
eukprot:TRINITY_DN482_c0_g1_i1.p1 TRINITY_DN482_c0_g1~~TRINITY_DN482_c0_g1_i1.p1  ORF type:complete len:254 (-),score=65.59 TRINITY_DN482_c0_g1_i1:284-1045(-)